MHSRFILDCFAKGLWDGYSDNESHASMLLKTCVAFTILATTPVSPFIAATIPVIGVKRVYESAKFVGLRVFERCRSRRENIDETIDNSRLHLT